MNEDIKNVILGTGSYSNIKKGNTLSITGDGGLAWGYHGNAYKRLAPRLVTYTTYAEKLEQLKNMKEDLNNIKTYYDLKKQIEDEYIESFYDTRLKDLDVYDLLYFFKKKYGENIIILCHEPVEDFCHRRLFADYLELKTGIYIPEIITDGDKIKKVLPIRYKKRLEKVMNK